jgi:hypothetical protein
LANSVRDKAKKLISFSFPTYRLAGYSLPEGLLALVVYLSLAWFILPPHAFWSPDEGAKLLQLQHLRLENGRLAYDIEYTGRQLDPELQFASMGLLEINDKRLYLQRFPIFPWLTQPFFRWLGFPGLYVIPAIGGAVITVLTLQLLPPRGRRLALGVLVAFASPVLIYASIFWEHTLATGLCLAAAWLSFQIDPTGRAASFYQITK